MLKKSKMFENGMREALQHIISEKALPKNICNNSPEIIKECIDRGYLYNVDILITEAQTIEFSTEKPRVSYSGIKFIETRHPKFKENASFVISIVAISVTVLDFLSGLDFVQKILNYLFS